MNIVKLEMSLTPSGRNCVSGATWTIAQLLSNVAAELPN
jgi:hypothetical protein